MGNSDSKKSRNAIIERKSIPKPPPILSEEEFHRIWPSWRNDFLAYKEKYPNSIQWWDNALVNLMGPVGRDIYKTFSSTPAEHNGDVDTLLEKFHEYFIFGKKRRLPREDIYEYIDDLQQTTKQKNIENGEELIRKRIIAEIDKVQFTNAAKTVLPTFSFSLNFHDLTLKEIAFIWNMYYNDTANSCQSCAGNHGSDTCPALNKNCKKCNRLNHFVTRCPQKFNHNCDYCGGSHNHRCCPAFNETCRQCKRKHHFSWRCQVPIILRCCNCNMSHGASRSLCPARESICTSCHAVGHFASRCRRTSHTYK